MTMAEYVRWLQFRKLYGPLNPIRRNDEIIAQVATIATSIMARKKVFQPHDFSPYLKDPEEDEELSLDEAFQTLAGVAKKNEVL